MIVRLSDIKTTLLLTFFASLSALFIFVPAFCQEKNEGALWKEVIREVGLNNIKPAYVIPLYSLEATLIGRVEGYEIDDKVYEFIFLGAHPEHFFGLGRGSFLRDIYDKASSLAANTLALHFGREAEVIGKRLIYANPISFYVQVIYRYRGKEFQDLFLQAGSLRFALLDKDVVPKGDPAFLKFVDLELEKNFYHERIDYPFVWRPLYISDFVTSVIILSDFWSGEGFITVPLYPRDPFYAEINFRLMAKDLEMLQRTCACEDKPKGVADIIAAFINARSQRKVKIKVWQKDLNGARLDGYELSFARIKSWVEAKSPLLMQISLGRFNSFAILQGVLSTGDKNYIQCFFPTKEGGWDTYFFQWNCGYKTLKMYEVIGG